MKLLTLTAGLVVLAPSLALAHGAAVDKYGCHKDTKKGDYHCHEGSLKGRSYQSQDTLLRAHPELRAGAKAGGAGEQAKKEKAEDKLKDGDKTRTEEYAQDARRKTSAPSR